jgi:hypothetical protein
MKILSREELIKLPTKSLLAYKKRLLKVDGAERCSCGSVSGCDFRSKELLAEGAFIKSSPQWQELYALVKEILNTREHIPRKNGN